MNSVSGLDGASKEGRKRSTYYSRAYSSSQGSKECMFVSIFQRMMKTRPSA